MRTLEGDRVKGSRKHQESGHVAGKRLKMDVPPSMMNALKSKRIS